MAAKYLRKQTWWLRFYHPRSNELVRESLGISDEARAELLRKRVELERDAIAPDLSFLSVVNRIHHDTDVESSLKTGERP